MKSLFSIYLFLFSILIACSDSSDCCAQPSATKPISVSIGLTGDAADVKTTTQFGVVLMGGSTDVDEAIQWMISKSGGGDFVIIRASGSTGYNEYIKSLGNLNSVETLLIDSKEKANLTETRDKIRNAEALFIAGGDQGDYVKFWTDTEVSKAIQYLIDTKKVPIGGTSAGCAVLSEYIFDARNGGVVSEEALANPYNSLVSISKSFISIPVLKNVFADQHYSQRTRQGRHVVFLARAIKDFNLVSPLAIGVDEKTAVLVEENGNTKIVGANSAYFLQSNSAPEQCESDKELIWNRQAKAVKVYIRNSSSPDQLNILHKITSPVDQFWSVVGGVLKTN
jgi:cyanophycinase